MRRARPKAGNEFLYQSLALQNIETLNGYGVTKIVTPCPHCLQTLSRDYRQLGGEFTVVHHTQYLLDLVRGGRLVLASQPAKRVAYHDSCYLARYNGIQREPRELLEAAGFELVEPPRRKAKTFCCGGGGGRMWLEEDEGERINRLRTDQLLSVVPDVVAVACPYCLTMIGDGLSDRGADGSTTVMDVSQILQGLADRG